MCAGGHVDGGSDDTYSCCGHWATATLRDRELFEQSVKAALPVFQLLEQSYKAALPVFQLLGAENAFRTSLRPDKHIGWIQVERYIDWFDIALNLSSNLELDRSFPQKMLYNFSWDAWNNSLSVQARERALSVPPPAASTRERVAWGLGKPPIAGPVFSPGYGGENPRGGNPLVGNNSVKGPIEYRYDGTGCASA